MEFSTRPTDHEKSQSWQLFNQIAPSYDLANRILSVRQDVAWRKRLSRLLPDKSGLKLLDLATGTGDQILFLLKEAGASKFSKCVGLDLSEGMLTVGREKIKSLGLDSLVTLKLGDATMTQEPDATYDAVTMSFGIRNVNNVKACLSEMYRVLVPGGRAMILEFSLPQNKAFKDLYLFYFRNILPRLGGMISGNTIAYKYLNNSVEDFPYGQEFIRIMQDVGFAKAQMQPLTLGIATIYVGEKVLNS